MQWVRILRLPLLLVILPITLAVQNADNLKQISVDNIDHIEQVATITSSEQAVMSLNWNRQGTKLAIIREDDDPDDSFRQIEIRDFRFQEMSDVSPVSFGPINAQHLRWFPDGQSLVTHGANYTGDGVQFDVRRWDTDTGELIETFLDKAVVISENDFLPVSPPILGWNSNYSEFAVPVDNKTLRLSDGGTFTNELFGVGSITQALWSSDDRHIVVLYRTTDTYMFHILDSNTLESIMFAFGSDYYVCDFAWSPDGETLAVASVWANLFVPSVNVRFYRVDEIVNYGDEVVLSADIDAESGYRPCRSGSVLAPPPGMAWNHDGTIFVVSFPTATKFYETEAFTEIASIDDVTLLSLDWHPSGRIMVGGDVDGTIRFFGVTTTD